VAHQRGEAGRHTWKLGTEGGVGNGPRHLFPGPPRIAEAEREE
jgi:hypothetical protein